MNTSDEELRRDRVVFYARDMKELDGALDALLERSGARSAMLIDVNGHLVTSRGERSAESQETLSALTAASFAATQQMARLLGEDQFSNLFHQGEHDSIQVTSVDGRSLLVVVWDERSNLGLVRFHVQQATTELGKVFAELNARPAPDGEDALADDFADEAASTLDQLF